jgi:hypothetical protein
MARNVADVLWEMLVSAGVKRCYGPGRTVAEVVHAADSRFLGDLRLYRDGQRKDSARRE